MTNTSASYFTVASNLYKSLILKLDKRCLTSILPLALDVHSLKFASEDIHFRDCVLRSLFLIIDGERV